MNLKDILKELGESSHSFRDKGTKFEWLIKNWFLTIYSKKSPTSISGR